MAEWTDEQWATAREAWESGSGKREASRLSGIPDSTIRDRARVEGWQYTSADVEARMVDRRRQTEAATLAAERAWANRRSDEADGAGISASLARRAIIEAIERRDDKNTRAAAIAYGILIDKAQLLSGAATARVGAEDPRERAQALLDELAEKRRQRDAS